jgi:hypothetical protein
MQWVESTGDDLTATELDQAETLEHGGGLDPAPEIAVEALDQTEQPTGATRSRHKRRNRGGRPSRLTIDMVVKLTTALLERRSLEFAARECGIGVSTLYRWMARARAGDQRFGPVDKLVKEAKRGRPFDFGMTFPKPERVGFGNNLSW